MYRRQNIRHEEGIIDLDNTMTQKKIPILIMIIGMAVMVSVIAPSIMGGWTITDDDTIETGYADNITYGSSIVSGDVSGGDSLTAEYNITDQKTQNVTVTANRVQDDDIRLSITDDDRDDNIVSRQDVPMPSNGSLTHTWSVDWMEYDIAVNVEYTDPQNNTAYIDVSHVNHDYILISDTGEYTILGYDVDVSHITMSRVDYTVYSGDKSEFYQKFENSAESEVTISDPSDHTVTDVYNIQINGDDERVIYIEEQAVQSYQITDDDGLTDIFITLAGVIIIMTVILIATSIVSFGGFKSNQFN